METSIHIDADTKNMSDEELRRELLELKKEQWELTTEQQETEEIIDALRSEAAQLQANAEIEEEHVANTLLRRLEVMERDKRRYEQLLKAEEDARTDTVRQIMEVRQQQTDIENQLEKEQEYLMLQLQKKLMDVAAHKAQVEKELVQEHLRYMDLLREQLQILKANAPPSRSSSMRVSPRNSPAPQDSRSMSTTSSVADMRAADHSSTDHFSPSHAGMPSGKAASTPLRSNRETVIALERKLNDQLAKHIEAINVEKETSSQCADLTSKLENLQEATFLDRARAAKLREDLEQMRNKLASIEQGGVVGDVSGMDLHNSSCTQLCRSPSTMTGDDVSCNVSTTPRRNADSVPVSRSLRDHTLSILSAPLDSQFVPQVSFGVSPHARHASGLSEVSLRESTNSTPRQPPK